MKGNQATLFQAIKEVVSTKPILSPAISNEQARGHQERRKVAVFAFPDHLAEEWKGGRRVIAVERQVVRNGKETLTHHYSISQ